MELYEKYIKEELNSDGTLRAISFDAPKNFNFAYDVVDEFAKTEPMRKAMIWVADDGAERIFTFKEISVLSNQVANFFTDLGIKRGDRVMLILRRHYEFWLAIVALHKIGAIAIPATDQLKKKDVVYRIEKAGVTAIVCTSDGTISGEVEKAASEKSVKNLIIAGKKDGWTSFSKAYEYPTEFDRRETDIDDIMLMYFTSGTTSYPKMAAHTYSYALAHFVTAKWWHCVKKDGIHFTVAETGWGKAVWGKLYGQWLCGACVFTFDFSKFDQDRVLRMIEKYKITKNENNMLNYTFNQSIIKYGKEAQCRQLMEECAELIKATNKMLRYADRPAEPEYYANLIEEIADVEIMLYQLKVMFNISDDEVFAFKVEKAKREQERLKKL